MKCSMIIHPDELSFEWIDRLRSAGVKTLGIHPTGGNGAARSLEDLLQLMKREEYRRLIDYALSVGLEVEYEIHAMGYLLQRSLFSQHPEYFRMNENGVRTSDYNLCASSPEALDTVARAAAKLASSLYGSNGNYHFWLDDGHNLHCHCPECRKLSASDQALVVINRMLREIKKKDPSARMAYLAYMDSIVPPLSVKADAGVFLEYAPFEKYTAKGSNADMLIAREREMIKPLMQAFVNEPKQVLEYWYDNSLFSNWQKPPEKFTLDEGAMRSDIESYKEIGFDVISTFACFLGKDYEDLHGEVDVTPFSEAVFVKS